MSWNCLHGTRYTRTRGSLVNGLVETIPVNVPQQLDGNSCGVHVVESAEYFLNRVAAVGRIEAFRELRSGRFLFYLCLTVLGRPYRPYKSRDHQMKSISSRRKSLYRFVNEKFHF